MKRESGSETLLFGPWNDCTDSLSKSLNGCQKLLDFKHRVTHHKSELNARC